MRCGAHRFYLTDSQVLGFYIASFNPVEEGICILTNMPRFLWIPPHVPEAAMQL